MPSPVTSFHDERACKTSFNVERVYADIVPELEVCHHGELRIMHIAVARDLY
jgi:hypothetical protein